MWVYATCVWIPLEVRIGHPIPWSQNRGWLWDPWCGALGAQLRKNLEEQQAVISTEPSISPAFKWYYGYNQKNTESRKFCRTNSLVKRFISHMEDLFCLWFLKKLRQLFGRMTIDIAKVLCITVTLGKRMVNPFAIKKHHTLEYIMYIIPTWTLQNEYMYLNIM